MRMGMMSAGITLLAAASLLSGQAPAIDAQRANILKTVDAVAAAGPFKPDWKSLSNYKLSEWYADAKFGIFIHWGRSGILSGNWRRRSGSRD
jgi:hypothetical protein